MAGVVDQLISCWWWVVVPASSLGPWTHPIFTALSAVVAALMHPATAFLRPAVVMLSLHQVTYSPEEEEKRAHHGRLMLFKSRIADTDPTVMKT